MKSERAIDETLHAFEKRFGLTVRGAQQRSEAWFNLKLGVPSASNASKIVAGKDTEGRLTYMSFLVAQVCTGVIEEMNFKQLEWGNENEDAARANYELAANQEIKPLTFVFKDDTFRVGCSPDGYVELNPQAPVEIKCPWDSTNYIKFLVEEKVKPEWVWQNQFQLWVLEAERMDICMYDPRMKTKPLHVVPVYRSEEHQKKLDDLVPQFILDMDNMLAKIGVKFGDQWDRIAKKQQQEQGVA